MYGDVFCSVTICEILRKRKYQGSCISIRMYITEKVAGKPGTTYSVDEKIARIKYGKYRGGGKLYVGKVSSKPFDSKSEWNMHETMSEGKNNIDSITKK